LEDKTTSDWLDILLPADIWCSHVNQLDTMINDPQVSYNQMILKFEHPSAGEVATTGFPVRFSETPCNLYAPPPSLGEHTDIILENLTVTNTHE
jgi:crotonobetainyl-CoA:carnitine CoA-transferase CaiB-like acyl-CoA transferase